MESNIRYMIFYYFFSPSEMFLWKLDPQGVFVKDNLCNIPGAPLLTWISNYIHYKVWDKITYPFPNWEWISNFIPHFSGHVITYPWWD